MDTSMGMTPLEGLVMGTRSGDLDPAIVNLIATKEGMSPSEVDTLLNTQSGLLGISGLTNDMRVLQAELKEHDDGAYGSPIEVFCYRARKYIGAYLACHGRGRRRRVYRRDRRELAGDSRSHLREAWNGPASRSTQRRTSRRWGARASSAPMIPSCSPMPSRPTKSC